MRSSPRLCNDGKEKEEDIKVSSSKTHFRVLVTDFENFNILNVLCFIKLNGIIKVLMRSIGNNKLIKYWHDLWL